MWSVARYFFRKLPGVSNKGIFALASGVLAVLVYTFLDSRSLDAQQFYSNMNAVIQLREISDILEKSLLQSRSAQPEDFENIKLSFSVAQEVSQDLKKSLSSSLWFDKELQRQLQTYIDSLGAKEALFHELEAAKTVEEKNQVFVKLVAVKTASQLSSFSDAFLVGNKAALNRNSRHKFILYFLVMLLGTYMALAMVQLRYAKEAIKKQYDLIAHQQETLTQTAKLSALGEMASGIAHEINNPLQIIQLNAQKMQMDLANGSSNPVRLQSSLDKIVATVSRVTRIIKGLRNLSRDGALDIPADINLESLLDETSALLKEKMKTRSVELKIQVDPRLTLKGRSVQLGQVFLNLISNSIDAIEKLDYRWIKVEAHTHHDKVVIKITDSGTGIPIEKREKLFQPFFTTKEVGKGTGLGLSISRGIIQNHGGTISLDTHCPNTCFVITLPLDIVYSQNQSRAA